MTLTINVRSKLACVTTAALLLPLLAPVTASAAAMAPKAQMSFWDAMSNGDAWMSFRPRYEYASIDDGLSNANAFTMRTLLGYKTGSFKGFVGTLEFGNVARLTRHKNFNDGVTGDATYSAVNDPANTIVSQANIAFNGLQETALTLGRQMVVLDNARFVGDVAWRQTSQRFDAFRAQSTYLPNTKIDYTYAWNVERIFGVAALGSSKRYDADSHLLNITYSPAKWAQLVPYAYIVNNKNLISSSSDTYGIRFTGESPEYSNGLSVYYTAEYASQKGAHNNPSTAKFKYMNFELGAKSSMFGAMIGYEFLGGNGTATFQTPYSTIHNFNGWADLFIDQSAAGNVLNGLKDTSFTVTADVWGMTALARYHDFRADNTSMKYGNEVDLQLTKEVNKNVTVLAKYASFTKKDVSNLANRTNDTKKFWLQTTVGFS